MSVWTTLLAMAAAVVVTVAGNYPTFEGVTELRDNLMVPAGAPVGSLIYRLRASDHDKDYPLYFQATDFGSYVIRIENLPCPPNTTAGCQADVYLDRVLIPGQTFQFRITVRDTRGDTTTVPVRLVATEARSDVETIFPHIPAIIIVPEDVKVNTELEYVIVKKNTESRKSASIELRGSPELTIGRLRMNKDTTTGTISVSRPLDFETKNMYRLQVVALDMYVEIGKDSRNAAAFEVIVVVEDVQDTAPIFTRLETIVHLHNNMSIGDIVTKVEAIDGDRGRPRRIKYGLVSENRPFTVLFEIGLFTGEVKLKRSMSELTKITGGKQPAILTVMADEEVTGTGEPPAMSTLADLVLILDDVIDRPPYFHNENYACRLNENSGQGMTLAFTDGYVLQVHDDSLGKESVYSLTLENNNGTFEVTPAVIDRHSRFTIMVRNNHLLDYESRRSVRFEMLATELSVPGGGGDTNRTRTKARASVVVYLDDVNDNAPRFTRAEYNIQLPENATAGVRVTTVEAVDLDTGLFGSVRYTAVLGFKNSSLVLDPITGVIVVSNDNHGFDREESAEYRLNVEARDMDGRGLATTVPLIIHVLDINDETPVFQDMPIQFVLTQDMRNFTERAFIKAIDKDAEAPNNLVRYEIINGNYNNRFTLNPETGELFMSSDLYDSSRTRRDSTNSASVVLTVRAYDLGVPHRSSTTQVRIYPPSSGARQMTFLIPASMDVAAVHNLLERLTGGKVTINSIKPNYEHVQRPAANTEKNIVTATVAYNTNTVIDVEEFRKHLAQCNNEVQMAQVDYRNDKNLSFWLNLLLLLAILLAALSLLFCCCYQQYLRYIHNKLHHVDRNTKNKGIQAPSLNSTESTENNPRQKVYVLSEKPVTPIRIAKRTRTMVIPNMVKKKASAESLLIEDVEGNEYRIIDKRRSWSDETTDTRQEMFFKQGNAEILRIMSNDSLEVMDSASNMGGFNAFDEFAGKKVIMNKFLNSQPDEGVVEDQYNGSVKGNAEKTQREEIKKDDIDEEQKKMTAFQRDVLLTKFLAEEQQKLMTKLETRSLPGANIATQTEMHAGTQTTRSCLRATGGGGGRRSRSYDDRECSRSAHCPRRATSVPRRQLFNSPIMEETGSGSGASSGLRSSLAGRGATGTGSVEGGSGSVAGESGVGTRTGPGRRRLFATSSASSLSADVDKRKSRSYSSIRELDLDRQLQYMTPSLRSRALARRRLSTSLPPHGCRSVQMLEKKSVFTIAYGDVATQKINCSADSSSNNWE
ncbi:PREDICTED: cadherin-86C [Diuraphis noxia]|uniref:cadherin-86C n=1 Tax=Diuraphis noxia TaxID=143948 RepID=UPI0007637B32|nr:PREDICTED: cadherin-86C [Diuraphis noxia]XP_015369770.1 PREDICTED: cadherin-86C [Diuraphis noxia]XP_015369772.1 PREDICTED: cadherin-86C [Diuraphis noxia]XP_015369773.1 PREDICTED: cadherin-86C [Diuraphis noxia]